MAWFKGEHCKPISALPCTNKRLSELKGELPTDQAQRYFVEFLQANPHFATNLLSGVDIYEFQDIIIRALFQKDFSLVIAGRGLSKCIEKTSLVYTNKGIKEIQDVKIGEYILAQKQPQLITNKIKNAISEGFEITTDKGTSFSGIIGHRTLVYNSDSFELEYKNIEDIKVGDYVVCKLGGDLWGDNNDLDLDTSYLLGVLLGDEEIPDKILASNKKIVCSFLRGLFDTDGYCSEQKKTSLVGLTSTNLKLLQQVKVILQNLGIKSSIKVTFKGGESCFPNGRLYECRKAWSLIICGFQNLQIFNEHIGFRIKRKQNLLDRYLDKIQVKMEQSLIPNGALYLRKKYKFPTRLRATHLSSIRATIVLPFIEEKDQEFIKTVLNDNLHFEKVDSIVNTQVETYDITVDREECYVGNGIIHHNSFTAAMFAFLYAVFVPGIKIGVCSASFRQARGIFQQIEKWAYHPKGVFLRQCIKGVAHRPEAWEMDFNHGSFIACLPLGAGDKIRGYRFNVMILDELLLLTDKIINEVIQPFLAIQHDPRMRQQIREAEDKLIKAGKITEDERYVFPSNKLIGLTSASYKFEYLYKLYESYKDLIFDEHASDVNHAIFQLSCEVAPPGLYDMKMVETARKTSSAAQFGREYMAHFSDDSSGYYSAMKMEQATVKPGDEPSIKLIGEPNKTHVLSIDPNYNESESSDHFAMCILEADFEHKTGAVVHNYALSKSSLKNRALYLKYLLEHFNIEYVITDAAGGMSFINDLVHLDVFSKPLKFFEHDFDNDNYLEGIMKTRASYNLSDNKIVHAQQFNKVGWIRAANEYLQASIEHKRIMFGAKLVAEDQYQAQLNKKIPILDLEWASEDENTDQKLKKNPDFLQAEFIDHQNALMDLLKKEMALIEISTTSTGHQSFDLPQNLRRDKSVNRARKDSYTALLLAAWGLKCLFELKSYKEPPKSNFKPTFIV